MVSPVNRCTAGQTYAGDNPVTVSVIFVNYIRAHKGEYGYDMLEDLFRHVLCQLSYQQKRTLSSLGIDRY